MCYACTIPAGMHAFCAVFCCHAYTVSGVNKQTLMHSFCCINTKNLHGNNADIALTSSTWSPPVLAVSARCKTWNEHTHSIHWLTQPSTHKNLFHKKRTNRDATSKCECGQEHKHLGCLYPCNASIFIRCRSLHITPHARNLRTIDLITWNWVEFLCSETYETKVRALRHVFILDYTAHEKLAWWTSTVNLVMHMPCTGVASKWWAKAWLHSGALLPARLHVLRQTRDILSLQRNEITFIK